MNLALDQLLVAALILGALGFFLTRFLRRRTGDQACGGECCGASKKRPAVLK